jgi:hypothetical protein
MNSQERLLISQLFDRLRSAANAPRDPEAEAFIRSQIGAQPHAPYAMAQTIIVQNQAIEAAQARIQELEAQLRGDAGYDRPRSALGGMGGARGDDRPMGAPDLGGGQASGPWAHQRQQAQPQQPQAAGGGGFLAGAAQTALGVAGGVMLGSMLGGMFGSSSAKAEPAAAADNSKDDQTDNAADDTDGDDEGGDGWFSDLFGGDGDGGGGDW